MSREAQDEFACRSHLRAVAAQDAGKFRAEIAPVPIPQRKGPPCMFETDENPRRDTCIDVLRTLKPAFKEGGTVTAGNAPGITDGAAATVVARRRLPARWVSSRWRGSLATRRPRSSRWSCSPRRRLQWAGWQTDWAWRPPTSTWSRSTRRSPRRRWPTSGHSNWTRKRSTSTAAPSRSATPSALAAARILTTLLYRSGLATGAWPPAVANGPLPGRWRSRRPWRMADGR